MRLLATGAALFVLSWGAATAQSLTDVAKKEKQRRAGSESGESVPVIDDEQLSLSRGESLSVMGTEPSDEPVDSEGAGEDSSSASTIEDRRLSAKEIRDYRETWARVWAERLAAAEEELELAEEAVFQCQSAAHYVYVPLAIDCSHVFERRAVAEYVLKETRENQFNWELLLPETKRPPPQP